MIMPIFRLIILFVVFTEIGLHESMLIQGISLLILSGDAAHSVLGPVSLGPPHPSS